MENQAPSGMKVNAISGGTWSIVKRLTVWYTVWAFIILFFMTALLYWRLASNMRDEDDEFLVDEIQSLRAILREHPNETGPLQMEVEVESTARPFAKYYARIFDETDRIITQTAGMNEAVPSADKFPPPEVVPESLNRGTKWRSPNGQAYLLTSARAEVDATGRGHKLIQVALDITHKEETLDRYRQWLALVLCFGIIGSAGAAVAIARKGLEPLEAITQAAQGITATQLSERISPRAWPRELALLATEFDKMLARLEESFIRLSQFSADLAHELRTPINNLMGEAEVSLSRTRSPDEYRQVLESSLEEYGRLSRMIDSLLFLARADNTEMQIHWSLFDAHKEIKAVLEFYEAWSAEEGIELAASGHALLKADVILFRRALSNLLANAVNYTARNGKILVNAQPTASKAVEISVSDTGAGIPAEHLPKIFDRFYRVDPSRSQAQGTGLGLAIVKSIMELHGGTVTVRSEPGTGTVFTLRFPASHKTQMTNLSSSR